MDRVAFLESTDLFSEVRRDLVEGIAAGMLERRARVGECIFREGEFGDAAYLIIDGSLELRVGDSALLSRSRGECVGEFALMDNAPRSASAFAETDVHLLRWNGEDFDRALREDESGELSTAVLKMLTRKLREDVTRHQVTDRFGAAPRSERFERVNAVFQEVLELPSVERGPRLERLCEGDLELVAEVKELLGTHREMGSFLEWYLPDDPDDFDIRLERETAARSARPLLDAGGLLGSYEIVACLGVGGMAQVYAARDRELGREVAIKLLPPELARSARRRRRLEREARIVARLNHPNIVTLYSAEESDGLHFITMELVDGETLADRIPKGGMRLDDFVAVALPVLSAVGAAHEKGITHRDLKPENIMVARDGRVKVLDFGLAKARTPFGEDLAHSDVFKTAQGYLLGTIAYMSPEQAEGKAVDERSDIFSLGVLFYQMLTAQTPFNGDSPTAILSSILRDSPIPVRRWNPEVSVELERLVEGCLEKDVGARLQRTTEVERELLAIAAAGGLRG